MLRRAQAFTRQQRAALAKRQDNLQREKAAWKADVRQLLEQGGGSGDGSRRIMKELKRSLDHQTDSLNEEVRMVGTSRCYRFPLFLLVSFSTYPVFVVIVSRQL